MAWRGLTKQPWDAIRVHLPEPTRSARGGRPCIEARRCLEGILWMLWTGSPGSELPQRYGSPSTCWRRLTHGAEAGLLLKRWRAFVAQLTDQQKLRWDEGFADGSCMPATKGGPTSARRHAARGPRGWGWSMARVLRWEQTWTRPPRRKSPSLRRPSTRSRAGAPASLDAPASAPTACWRIAATTALPCAPAGLVGASSHSSPHAATPSGRPIQMAASCGGTGDGGWSSGRSRGWAMFGASSCAMSI
jgi:transposase